LEIFFKKICFVLKKESIFVPQNNHEQLTFPYKRNEPRHEVLHVRVLKEKQKHTQGFSKNGKAFFH